MKSQTEVIRRFSFLLTYWSAQQQVTPVTLDPHTDEANPADSPTMQRKATIKQEDNYAHI